MEAVIREDLTLRAYEILELYLELIAVRADLLAKVRCSMALGVCKAGRLVGTRPAVVALPHSRASHGGRHSKRA